MKQCFAIRNLVIAGTVSLASGLLGGLQRADQSDDFKIRSDVRLVLLDVSVKDREGGFVSGLSKDNFSIFENGRPQPITVFANDDLPVTVGILVDESFSMRTKRDEVITAAQTFIEESNPRDEIFVLNFNDRVKRGLPDQMLFSDDIQQLRSALYRGVPQGKTALNDAIVDDCVVESGLALRNTPIKSGAQLLNVVGKEHLVRQPTLNAVVKVENENLIAGIALFNEGLGRCNNLVPFGPHAEALIHQDSDSHGKVVISEHRNRLRPAVFKDAEVVL